MSLIHLLLVAAIILLAATGLTSTGDWIYWAAGACAAVAGVLSITSNDRDLS